MEMGPQIPNQCLNRVAVLFLTLQREEVIFKTTGFKWDLNNKTLTLRPFSNLPVPFQLYAMNVWF